MSILICGGDLKAQRDYDEVIFTAPDGEVFNQKIANSLSMLKNIVILCGHYKGIDSCFQASILAWCPLRSISGTLQPLYTAGRV